MLRGDHLCGGLVRPGVLPAEWCVSGPHWGLVGGNVCDVLRCCSRWILNGPPPGEKDPQSAAESPLLLSPVVVKSFQSSRWGQESRDADPPARSPGTQGHLVTPALVWGGEGKSSSEKLSVPLCEQLSRSSESNAAVEKLRRCLQLPLSVRGALRPFPSGCT